MTVIKDFIMTMIKGLNSLKLSKQVLKIPVFRYASNLRLINLIIMKSNYDSF